MKETETELTVLLGHKFGRDNHSMFANFKRDETSAMRLIRTVADVLGPRGM